MRPDDEWADGPLWMRRDFSRHGPSWFAAWIGGIQMIVVLAFVAGWVSGYGWFSTSMWRGVAGFVVLGAGTVALGGAQTACRGRHRAPLWYFFILGAVWTLAWLVGALAVVCLVVLGLWWLLTPLLQA